MNYFEKILRLLFEKRYPAAAFVGRKCLIPLGTALMAEIYFATNGTADHYSVLQIDVTNRSTGECRHALTIRLQDLWGNVMVGGLPREPHIWVYTLSRPHNIGWYGFTPTDDQYEALRDAAHRCMSMYGSGPETAPEGAPAASEAHFKLLLTCPICGSAHWVAVHDSGVYECECGETCLIEEMSATREEEE